MTLLLHKFQQQINENMQTIKQKILTTKFSHHLLQLGEDAGRGNHFCCNQKYIHTTKKTKWVTQHISHPCADFSHSCSVSKQSQHHIWANVMLKILLLHHRLSYCVLLLQWNPVLYLIQNRCHNKSSCTQWYQN